MIFNLIFISLNSTYKCYIRKFVKVKIIEWEFPYKHLMCQRLTNDEVSKVDNWKGWTPMNVNCDKLLSESIFEIFSLTMNVLTRQIHYKK